MSFLRPLRSFIRIFQRLLGMLVSSLMIFFPVVRCSSTMRVCGEFVELGSSLVRLVWHCISNPNYPLQLRIVPFPKLCNYEHSRRDLRRMPN